MLFSPESKLKTLGTSQDSPVPPLNFDPKELKRVHDLLGLSPAERYAQQQLNLVVGYLGK